MIIALIFKVMGKRKMAYKAVDIAWEILRLAKGDNISLTNLQLQKLVYIAHGYMLGWKGRPLSSEQIEAWEYGPVVDGVYHQFKNYGRNPIPVVDGLETELSTDTDAKYILEGVLKLYGKKPAMELVNLTHQPGTPWDITWKKEAKHTKSVPIPDEVIKNHFRKLVNGTQVVGL